MLSESVFDFRKFDKNQLTWFYGLIAIYTLLIGYAVVQGYLAVVGLPAFFLILLLSIFKMDLVAYIALFSIPFSINLATTKLGIGVSLPSEPLLFGLFLIFWLMVFTQGGLDKRIYKHPVTKLLLIQLLWFFVTTASSSMPMVSFKSSLARICYVSVFYFLFLYLFSNYNNIKKFLWVYMIPLTGVIFYTIYNQAAAGFTEASAHIAMTPYYNDHTAYAAVLAFFIPVLFALTDDRGSSKTVRIISFIFSFIFVLAIVLSYTRAAWLALIVSFLCYLIFVFRINKWIIYSGIFIVLSFLVINQTQLIMHLQKNNKVSSTDFSAHVQSVGNISTDDSNIERINRWACAIRMWAKKPLLGYGPGTYMFKYAPFQKESEKSGISTNFGTGGGSHSEYLGPLSEQGILGPLWVILINIVVIIRTSKLIKRTKDRSVRGLAKGLLLGLVTYWIHGFMNYFLDTEKAAAPYFGFIAALVALDIYHDQLQIKGSAKRTATEQSNIIE